MKYKDELYLTVNDGKRTRRRGNWAIRHHGFPTYTDFMEQMHTLFDDLRVYLQMATEAMCAHVAEVKAQTERPNDT